MSISYSSAVGIDVCKKRLDVSWSSPINLAWVTNDDNGIGKLLTELKRFKPDIVVVESTGGYENALVDELHANGIGVHVANPIRIRRFAMCAGILAKTDKVDAKVMVRYALTMHPVPTLQPAAANEEINDLRNRHRQLIDILVAEKNRSKLAPESTKDSIREHIAWLNNQIKDLERKIADKIEASAELKKISDIVQSVPGVGPGTAASLLAGLPEIGKLSQTKITSLVGVAPFACDSGPFRGRRMIRGGRANVRTALYMAVIAALRCNTVIKEYYQRLLAANKCKKVAITACIRKLIIILNAMVKNDKSWCPT